MIDEYVIEYVYLKDAVIIAQGCGALIYLGLFIQSLIYINPSKSNDDDITNSVVWIARWCRALLCIDILGTMAPDYIPKVFYHEDVAGGVIACIVLLTLLSMWIVSKWMIAVVVFAVSHGWLARITHVDEVSKPKYISAMIVYFFLSLLVTWFLVVQGIHKALKFLSKRRTRTLSRHHSYWCEVEVLVFSSWLTARIIYVFLQFQLNDISRIVDVPVRLLEFETLILMFLLLLSLTSGFVVCLVKFDRHVQDNISDQLPPSNSQHLQISDLKIVMIKLLFMFILFGVVVLIIVIKHQFK